MFILSASALVLGLGVSPAKKTIDFEPESTAEIEFLVLNSEMQELNLSLSASGEAGELVFFEDNVLEVRADEYRKPFKVLLKFPLEMQPGIHNAEIQLKPVIPPTTENGLVAFLAPKIPLKIRVPYPEKYADISLSVLDVDEGTPVPVYLVFDNLGSEDISRAGGTITIKEPGRDEEYMLKTTGSGVKKGKMIKAQAEPPPVLRKGLYNAYVQAYYDSEKKDFSSNFSLGEPDVSIRQLMTRKLEAGALNKLVFRVFNDWNIEQNIRGMIEVNGVQNEMPQAVLAPGQEQEITAYLDARELSPGNYNLSLSLAYGSYSSTKSFGVVLKEPEEEKPISEQKSRTTFILVLLALIIIVTLVLALLAGRRKKRNRLS